MYQAESLIAFIGTISDGVLVAHAALSLTVIVSLHGGLQGHLQLDVFGQLLDGEIVVVEPRWLLHWLHLHHGWHGVHLRCRGS